MQEAAGNSPVQTSAAGRGWGGQNEVGRIRRVLLHHARSAFTPAAVERDWRRLGYRAAPDPERAAAEYDAFVATLTELGVAPEMCDEADSPGLDALYVRDAAVLCDRGAILCRMGKPARRAEPGRLGTAFERLGIPVIGAIEEPGCLEGGDVAWLDRGTLAVGLGYRTNASGIEQLGRLLGNTVDRLITVPLPHWKGPEDVFHLMSMLSPVDRDLAVVYSPLLPAWFRQDLLERGVQLVEVPDDEFETLGCNVLAVSPRRCLVVASNPTTRGRLEAAGCDVFEYAGEEISRKGEGGPTCLTLPLLR